MNKSRPMRFQENQQPAATSRPPQADKRAVSSTLGCGLLFTRARLQILLAACVLFAPPALCLADDASAPLRITRVALFKNGLGYFTAVAELPEEATTIHLGQVPVPVHGTFWATYDRGLPVTGLFARLKEVPRSKPVKSLTDLLAANAGREVKLYTAYDPQQPVSGMLLSVTQSNSPWHSVRPLEANTIRRRTAPRPGADSPIAIVVTSAGIEAVNVSAIEHCVISKGAVKTEYEVKETEPILQLELEQPAGGTRFWVGYLARGITWAPSYVVDLGKPDKARVSAKTVVMNEAADLDRVTLELVTGFPDLQFANIDSPMAMTQSLEQFVNALQHDRGNRYTGRAAVLSQSRESDRSGFGAPPRVDYAPPAQGRETEDLFLYPVNNVTLARGETAYFPLFTAELPYQHVYTWQVPDLIDSNQRARLADNQQHHVWHACRLTNTTEMPLTTGPAQFVKDGQIVGQNTCSYTNPGATTTIPISRATRITAQHEEHETDRKADAAKHHGYPYDQITVQGQLSLRSYESQPVTVEITKRLSGKFSNATDEPGVVALAEDLAAVNPTHRLTWSVELTPGQEKLIEYTYTVLVRR